MWRNTIVVIWILFGLALSVYYAGLFKGLGVTVVLVY
jgi:hypothetical protein